MAWITRSGPSTLARRLPLVALVAALQACTTVAAPTATAPSPRTASSESPRAGESVASTPSSSPSTVALAPLVGQWRLDRTCDAIVGALTSADLGSLLTKAQLQDMIARTITETIEGIPENGSLPPTWDREHPCADARPPTEHSHTFWADGRFNSYDENGNQVDDGTYTTDGDVLTMGDWAWTYHITDDQLTLDPILPNACATAACLDGLGWAFSVAYPGQRWTRVIAGPHVPPEGGSPN
jgi:hypothetical protein